MHYHRSVLPNGLRLIVIPMSSFESATVMIMVGAGSRYETRSNNGISHFLEHMAFKGTKKRPSALAISTLIDGIGGECNAFTGKETTGYYIKSSVNHVDLSLDILSDMLQNSLFNPQEIDKERGVIIEEINLYEDTPARKIGDVYERLLYGDTPLGWDIAGEKDNIMNISREDFMQYLKSLYSADNMTVVVAGGVEVKQTQKLVQKHFAKMPSFDALSYDKVVENQSKPGVLIKHKKTEQVHFAMGVRTVPLNHPHRYALSVLSAIMGGGMSSRLFHEVREKRGLAYYVRSHSEHYKDCGSFTSVAGVDPKRVDEAIQVVVEEYSKVAKNSIAKDEFTKAKEFLKGHFVLELEDSRAVAGFYAGQELLENTIDTPEEVIKKIDSVTIEDIHTVSKSYFSQDRLNLAIIGNFDPSTSSGQAPSTNASDMSSVPNGRVKGDRQRFEKLLQ